jgi:hypothetical protein
MWCITDLILMPLTWLWVTLSRMFPINATISSSMESYVNMINDKVQGRSHVWSMVLSLSPNWFLPCVGPFWYFLLQVQDRITCCSGLWLWVLLWLWVPLILFCCLKYILHYKWANNHITGLLRRNNVHRWSNEGPHQQQTPPPWRSPLLIWRQGFGESAHHNPGSLCRSGWWRMEWQGFIQKCLPVDKKLISKPKDFTLVFSLFTLLTRWFGPLLRCQMATPPLPRLLHNIHLFLVDCCVV